MKYKLLSVVTQNEINIGDYVQALAASQFYPQVDGYIERECLNTYSGDYSTVIMNGWYCFHPENWPPSDRINPLFVAFHLNSSVKDKFFTKETIEYLKKHSPIGCRDLATMTALQNEGIEAYFSGCLTLTLGTKYKSNKKNGKVYFVDAPVTFKSKSDRIIELFRSVTRLKSTFKLYKKNKDRSDSILGRWTYSSKLYKTYKKLFDPNIILDAEYVTQQAPIYLKKFNDNNSRLKEAERLVKEYSEADLVVTSRIHCALPCTGMETPVLFINDIGQDEKSTCRFNGLIDLFNVINLDNDKLICSNFNIQGSINRINHPDNPDSWKKIAKALENRCIEFVN